MLPIIFFVMFLQKNEKSLDYAKRLRSRVITLQQNLGNRELSYE